jgi:hypothetical protein
MVFFDDTLAVPEDEIFLFDAVVRRQSAFGFAQRHRAAAGVKAHADFFRCLDLAIYRVSVLENIRVVENHRATRKRQLRQPNEGADA